MSKIDTEELTRFEIPEGAHVLSVYLQTHSAESEEVFRRQIKEIQGRFEAESEQRELDDCIQRVWNFLCKFECRSPMLVVFCTATGSLWARQIEVILPNLVRWGDTPYWKSLIEVLDEFEPYGVLLAGEKQARLFGISVGRIHEHHFIGRDASMKRDDYIARILEATGEMIRVEYPNRLVVAGDRDVCSSVLSAASRYVQNSVIAVTEMPTNASMEQVLARTSGFEQLAERRFEIRLVDKLIRLAAERKKVALGIHSTLNALNDNRVWRLVYSDNFSCRGGHCERCGAFNSNELQMCAKCNVAVRPVDDLLAEMISRALSEDASIEQVRGEAAARLDELGGIGAFLRF
jgi:hypothetical protein